MSLSVTQNQKHASDKDAATAVVQNSHIMECICLRQQLNLLYAHRPIAWANRTHPHLFIIVWWTGNNKQFVSQKLTNTGT